MKPKLDGSSFVRWAAVFILPLPMVLVIQRAIVFTVPPEAFGWVSDKLNVFFNFIGLKGSPYQWDWHAATLELLLTIPYPLFAVALYAYLIGRQRSGCKECEHLPRCPACRYLLIGLDSERCPECGHDILA